MLCIYCYILHNLCNLTHLLHMYLHTHTHMQIQTIIALSDYSSFPVALDIPVLCNLSPAGTMYRCNTCIVVIY